LSFAARAAHAIASKLGGGFGVSGGDYRVRCPVHGGEDRHLSIKNGTKGADIVVRCFSHECDPVAILRAITELSGSDVATRRVQRPKRPIERPPSRDPDKPRALFDRFGQSIRGTPVATFLKLRCGPDLVMPSEDVIRFWPATPPRFPWPSMAAAVTDFLDAKKVLTLHFTYLLADGRGKAPVEAPKRSLKGYSTKGGVIRLVDDAEITFRLGIAEGIEKSLAIMTAYRREFGAFMPLPVWSGLNATVMGDLPVAPVIEQLIIYGDPNDAGRRSRDKLTQRWLEAGRLVFAGEPPGGTDWDEFDGAA
jgi:hypothetical protein